MRQKERLCLCFAYRNIAIFSNHRHLKIYYHLNNKHNTDSAPKVLCRLFKRCCRSYKFNLSWEYAVDLWSYNQNALIRSNLGSVYFPNLGMPNIKTPIYRKWHSIFFHFSCEVQCSKAVLFCQAGYELVPSLSKNKDSVYSINSAISVLSLLK